MAYRLLILACSAVTVLSHGRVWDPPSRATAWLAGFPTNKDVDDTGVDCGGWTHQWGINGGKCGICGDPYDLPAPRPHELGGIFGQGLIVAHYEPGSIISVTVELTATHWGFWEFKLCPNPLNNEHDCFNRHVLELENGGTKYYPQEGSSNYTVKYKLPESLVCTHCVLQWLYTTGHNWGRCANATEAVGCGNQEQFGACSDISIGVAKGDDNAEHYESDEIPHPRLSYKERRRLPRRLRRRSTKSTF